MYNFCGGCKILQGPRPATWDLKGLPFRDFLMLTAWSMQESHIPFTMHHPMHLPTKTSTPHVYMPPFNNLVLCPDYISEKR